MVLFDLNGTLTDPGAIGGAWGAPDLGVAVLARAVQSAMVDAILGNSRPFGEHIESALRDEVGRLGLEPERIDEALGMRPAFVVRDEAWASAYPRPDIEASSLPGIAAALKASSPAG